MSKFVDIDFILNEVASKMSNQASLPKTAFQVEEYRPDVDFESEMTKRAEKFYEKLLDEAHPKSTDVEGLGVKVLSPSEKQKETLRALGLEQRTKLAECAKDLRIIADKADKAGLVKQAADLRYVASKLA